MNVIKKFYYLLLSILFLLNFNSLVFSSEDSTTTTLLKTDQYPVIKYSDDIQCIRTLPNKATLLYRYVYDMGARLLCGGSYLSNEEIELLYQEAINDVEKILGYKFGLIKPKLIIRSKRSDCTMEEIRSGIADNAYGVYSPHDNTVKVLSHNICNIQILLNLPREELKKAFLSVLSHELVHAYQEKVFSNNLKSLSLIREGHATLVQHQLSKLKGMENIFKMGQTILINKEEFAGMLGQIPNQARHDLSMRHYLFAPLYLQEHALHTKTGEIAQDFLQNPFNPEIQRNPEIFFFQIETYIIDLKKDGIVVNI